MVEPADFRRFLGALGLRALARGLLALHLIEHGLAQAHVVRGDLDALVLAQELQRLVERQRAAAGTSRTSSSAVEERMLVSFFSRTALTSRSSERAVLADDHALVDLVAGLDEQRAALLHAGSTRCR